MDKVNLFLVGAAKSGTTSLAELWSKHTDIEIPLKKEPFYFVNDYGISSFEDYHRLYSKVGRKYSLDASTGYLFDELTPDKIFNYNPNAKVLIVLRNPIDFVFSYWQFMQANGLENYPFREAISETVQSYRKTEAFINNCEQWPASYQYLDRAMFYSQVKRYLDIFGKENLKVLLFEDLVKNNQKNLLEIYDFLEINSDGLLKLPKTNSSGQANKFIKWLRFSKQLKGAKLFLKKVTPERAVYRINKFLFDHSMNKRADARIKLSQTERNELKAVFKDDFMKLKDLLCDIDFTLWEDFNE